MALNCWMDQQIVIHLGLPVLMSFVLLGRAASFVNFELNRGIPSRMQNVLVPIPRFLRCAVRLYMQFMLVQ